MITITQMHWGPNCIACDGLGEQDDSLDRFHPRIEQCVNCNGLTVQMWCDWCQTEDCGTGEYRDWYRVDFGDEYHHCASWECVAACLEQVLRDSNWMEAAVRIEHLVTTHTYAVLDDEDRGIGTVEERYDQDTGGRPKVTAIAVVDGKPSKVGTWNGTRVETAAEAVKSHIARHKARTADTLPPDGTRVEWVQDGEVRT